MSGYQNRDQDPICLLLFYFYYLRGFDWVYGGEIRYKIKQKVLLAA